MPQMSANQTQIQTLPVALATITIATTSTISITRLTIISSLIPHPPRHHQKVAVRIADEVAFAVASFPEIA